MIISHPEYAYPNIEEEEESPANGAKSAGDIADATKEAPEATAVPVDINGNEMEEMDITVMDSSLLAKAESQRQEDKIAHPERQSEASKPGSPIGSAAASRCESAASQQRSASALMEDPTMDGDVSWLEDEEPVCGITDSWAQGSVPVQKTGQTSSRPLSRLETNDR